MCIYIHWHFLPLPSCNKGESALLPSELRSSWSWSFYGPWVLSYFLKVLLLQLPPIPLKQPVLFFSMGLLLIFLHPFTAYCLKKTCLHTFLHCFAFDYFSELSNCISSLISSPKRLIPRLPGISMLSRTMDDLCSCVIQSLSCIRPRRLLPFLILPHWFSSYL